MSIMSKILLINLLITILSLYEYTDTRTDYHHQKGYQRKINQEYNVLNLIILLSYYTLIISRYTKIKRTLIYSV